MSALSDHDSIRQLAARYSLALDSRDLDLLASLYAEDVDTRSPYGHGREAMRAYFAKGMTTIGRSAHLVTTHVIDLVDDDHATGVVYAMGNEERFDPPHWAVVTLAYHDKYVRRDGRWYFSERRDMRTFWTDRIGHPDNPTGITRHPELGSDVRLPEAWPTWGTFWANAAPGS